jgi:AraC-like DNA-binding protein
MASAIVLNSLIDILLVQLLRTWLAANPDRPGTSWPGVLDDPLMTEAPTELHEQRDRAWTTETLATEPAVSRSTVARRFTAVLGQSPGAYLAQRRMDLAARRLRDTDAPIAAVARSVGYTSQYAFSRAFTRARAIAGTIPGDGPQLAPSVSFAVSSRSSYGSRYYAVMVGGGWFLSPGVLFRGGVVGGMLPVGVRLVGSDPNLR